MWCSAPAGALFGGWLPWFVFWGYQLFIVMAATGYCLGITQSREYAEPEWYVDLWLTIVWVAYLLVFLGTLEAQGTAHLRGQLVLPGLHRHHRHAAHRQQPAVPVSFWATRATRFLGVQDALTQWWYGHNAVGFFLTAGFLGMMYYFVPKRAGGRSIPTACRSCTSGR
jgi:cytochrome c oxidase cbb3-type subunit 1